jgi:Tfp pilus assembly pilus retraction ATPase PilT
MRTTVPLEKLLEAYYIVQTIEEFIREEKQRLLTTLLYSDEDPAVSVHQTVQQYTQAKVRYRTLLDIERAMEHARYEFIYSVGSDSKTKEE